MIATLYAIAVAVLLLYGVNLLWLAAGFVRHYKLVSDEAEPGNSALSRGLPDVTVQLPVYNERYVVDRIIDACAELDYPLHKLEIQILDDSTDDTSERIAARTQYWLQRGRNVVHVQRSDREGFKAGALQRGLALTHSEFIAIFDADFVPPRDFLKVLLSRFSNDRIGMVQARWTYINRDQSLLTKLQALSLDAHFAVEQFARNRLGCFINFNGTAGIWRRACIEDAGGWEGDTLTEDLDLSYRAQLKGWSFVFANDIEAPSELPADINALRTQQFRWTKGSVQTARKVVGLLIRSDVSIKVKIEGLFHLTSHFVFPFAIMAAVLHAPVVATQFTDEGPSGLYFAFASFGLFAFAGVFLHQLFAQRSLYPDWRKRIVLFPVFVAASIGFAINNSLAIADAFSGRRTPFVRTPKLSDSILHISSRMLKGGYRKLTVPLVAFLELAMMLYSVAGLAYLVANGKWLAVPFQALFVCGFALISLYNIAQVLSARSRATAASLAQVTG